MGSRGHLTTQTLLYIPMRPILDGVCKGVRSGGPWSGADRHRHINELELLAAFNCVKAFSPFGSKLSILLYLDNATAVAYINKRGGTRSTRLNSLAMTFINWCEPRNILC